MTGRCHKHCLVLLIKGWANNCNNCLDRGTGPALLVSLVKLGGIQKSSCFTSLFPRPGSEAAGSLAVGRAVVGCSRTLSAEAGGDGALSPGCA